MSRHDHGHASFLEAFSAMTLVLQRLSQNKDIEHFHHAALSCMNQLLPFDSAWWGRAALIDGRPEEHNSYLYKLPRSCLPDWQSIRHIDVTVSKVSKGHACNSRPLNSTSVSDDVPDS